ncbi:MAG: C10 family peptidase [Bacteroidaceae bacterium]|nr:C10 family peptidase [Bacteroidaceae bacterium]
MKKTTLFLFLVSLLFTGVSAQTLTKEKAQSVAESFFKKGQRSQYATRSVRGNAAPALKCRWSSHDVVSASSEAPTFYAFEESLGQGFVIVSGDGENSRVLGYSFDSPLPKSGEMPDGMVDMLTAADSQVKAVRSGVASASVKAATPGGNIQVYLPTASWGQRAPFNNLCFTGTGESAATGCVPTAYAILMHYHKWPVCATETKVYHSASGESMTLGHTYDYANMLSSYSGTYTEAQATAVATLMRDLGWAYEVVYGTSATESGSGGETPSKLINIFKYSCATPNDHGNYATVRETLGDDTKWVQYIKESLDAGYPIPYSSTGDGGRHIFILDGYDDAGYYHFNWGWNGQGNGWFTLDAMTLEDGSDYSKSHRAYFMLKPNRPSHTVTASSAIGTMGSATVNGAASATVEEGTTITLSATPASADYVFVKWTKGEEVISRSATCEVTVTGAADYVAHFGEVAATADVEVAVTATTGGTATVNGTDAVTVSVGTKITLQATPIAGYYFVNWTKDGEVVSTEAEYSTTANTYCTYTANFAEVEKVTIAVKGSGGGYKYVGATGTETSMEVEKGSIAVVRTIPASDAKVFAYWTKGASYKSGGPIVSNKTTYEFVATESVDLYINYVDVGTDLNVPVSATSSNISGGTVTINGSTGTHNLPLGSEITLSAVAESGYRFLNWTKTTVSASALSVKSVGEVVSTEPTFTTVLTEEVTYTANFERLSVDPTPTTPPAGSSFIASDGVLRFYRLALPVTYTAYERTFGGSATDVYAFWEETEAYLNKLYIPLGICFDVVVDDKLIMKATNEIDTSADNAMGYGKELIDNQIGENAYDAGVWICYFELGANETGRTLREGAVYNPLDKAAVFSEPDGETIAHELGHHLGVSAHPQDNGLEIEMGQSLMSYGKPRDFLSVASIKIIREAIANSNAAYYSDENRTNLVGSNADGNYVYGKSVTGNSYPVINTAALKENYSIPKGAYFAFTIPATDADGDRLMYAFQQYESGAKFYTYGPSTNNTISFQPSYTLDANDDNNFVAQDGNNVFSEGVGTHNFVAVVNDLPAEANMTYAAMKNNPFFSKYDTYKTTLTIVDGTPFTMSLSPNKASYAAGEQVTVTWGVNTNYFNTGHKVRILLSDNYGESFDHVLAENVDATLGTYTVTMPDLNFSTAKKQFGDFSTTVRLGMIRVEVQDELAYTLSCSDPAAADATGGFLVTGGSGEGGGEQVEDLTQEKAQLTTAISDLKDYIATFATVKVVEMGGYKDYQVSFIATEDHGAVTEEMIVEAYRAIETAEAALETATTKAELTAQLTAVQAEQSAIETSKGQTGGGEEPGEGEGEEDLATVKANLQALTVTVDNLIAELGTVTASGSRELALTEASYFCNALYTGAGADQFKGYYVLFDKDAEGSTYLHTDYSDNAPAEDHYIRMDVGSSSKLQMFNLYYKNRGSGNNVCAPTKIAIEATNDATDADSWVTLRDITSGLPENLGAENTIENLGNGYPYQYIRMRVYGNSSSNQSANNHCYFVVNELGLSEITYTENLNSNYSSLASGSLLAAYKENMSAKALLTFATTVAEYETAYEALNAQYEALQNAKDAVGGIADKKAELQSLIDDTEALMGECIDGEVTFEQATLNGALTLQVKEPTEEFYLSTNADQNVVGNQDDGGGIAALLDSDTGTYMHTQWGGTAVSEDHYVQVTLNSETALEAFTFTYATRAGTGVSSSNTSPAPTIIKMYTSADGSSFTDSGISFTSTANALPAYSELGKYWTSAEVQVNKPKAIRFYVTGSAGPGKTQYEDHYFFAMSEFAFTAIGHPDRYLVTVKEDILANTGVTEDMLIATYVETTEAETALQNATTEAELDEAIAALQAQYEVLYSAKNQSFSRQELKDLIDDTQALIDACYDVKDGNKTFKYGGSLYITEQDANDAAAAVQEADDAYNLATLTQEQYNEQLSELQAVHKELAYAVSHATLPVQVTTDWATPYIYTIGINRSAMALLQLDEATKMVDKVDNYEFGNEAQAWCFIDAVDGRVLIVPYQEAIVSQNTITLGESTGKFTKSNNKGTWHSEWTGNDLGGLKFSAGANNMVYCTGGFTIHSGQAETSTWTLTAPEGYKIDSYSFNYQMAVATDPAETFTVNDTDYTCSAEVQTMNVKNVNSATTTFTQKGKNKGVNITNFNVVLRPLSLPVASTSYSVLASNDLAEGTQKVLAVEKDTEGYTQEWTIVPYDTKSGLYNIYCLNGNGDKFYFSYHTGNGQKMGFYNDVEDSGSQFRFGALEASSFGYSEAYNELYNYFYNDLNIHGAIVGNDDESAIGYYPTAQADAYNSAYNSASGLLKSVSVASDDECSEAYENLSAANKALKMHLPKETKYYRVKSAVVDGYAKGGYVYANPADNKLYWSADKGTSSQAVWRLINLGNDKFQMENYHTTTTIDGFTDRATSSLNPNAAGGHPVTIKSLSGDGRVAIIANNTMMHAREYNSDIVHWETDADGASAWIIEEIELNEMEYRLSISEYGYAGLYLNFPVEIPDGLQAYVVSKATGDNGVATLTEVKNIIPANTGVILKSQTAFASGKTEEYDLKYSSDPGEKSETNLLDGVNYLQYIKAEAETNYYLFGVKNETVGLYKSLLYKSDGTRDDENGDHIKCSGNKIYMAYSASAGAAKFLFKFDGGVTTDLEEALFGNDAKEEIYDLQGRRVERITAPGLYIVNGKKRYVKAAKF